MLYTDTTRGKIQNRARRSQIIDYSGLKYGKGTPTDVDGLLEYFGRGFVLYEFKLSDAPMSIGQRLALERLCDAVQKSDLPCTLLVCQHTCFDVTEDIPAAETICRELYYCGRWYKDGRRTAREVTDAFIHHLTSKGDALPR